MQCDESIAPAIKALQLTQHGTDAVHRGVLCVEVRDGDPVALDKGVNIEAGGYRLARTDTQTRDGIDLDECTSGTAEPTLVHN